MRVNFNDCAIELINQLDSLRECLLEDWKHRAYSKSFKSEGGYVTSWDLRLNEILQKNLGAYSWPIVSEEALLDHQDSHRKYWLIDPLDGTIEFIEGQEDFAVNVAFIEERKPIFGFIYQFTTGYAYWTTSFGVRFRDLSGSYRDFFAPQEQNFDSGVQRDLQNLILTLSSRQYRDLCEKKLKALPSQCKIYQRGASLKYIALLERQAMIYPRMGRCGIWDTAAGDAILRSVGGGIISWQNHQLLEYFSNKIYHHAFIAYFSRLSLENFLSEFNSPEILVQKLTR